MGTTFGFSAFLKLVSLNQRPRVTELKGRLTSSKKGGYDFHKKTRWLLTQLLVEKLTLEEVNAKAGQIANPHERASAIAAIKAIVNLTTELGHDTFHLSPATFESPSGLFKINLHLDFGTRMGGALVGVHVWNTKNPRLDPRLAAATLSLFSERLAHRVDDLAVVDLRRSELVRVRDATKHALLADRMVAYVEDMILDIRSGRSFDIGREDGLRP